MSKWNEVTVGETEIVSPFNVRQLVVGLHLDNVWTFNPESGDYDSWNKAAFTDWTIYDPWEDVSDQCEWVKIDDTLMVFLIHYKGHVIAKDDKNFKSTGRRVWKRKEQS